MAKKLTIAVDIDEVLVINFAALAEHHNRLYGTNHSVDDYDNDWTKVWGVNQKEAHRRADIWRASQDWIDRHEILVEGAVETLACLEKDYELVIVTGRSNQISEFTESWLERKFPKVFKQVHFVGLFFEGRGKTKAERCLEVGAAYLIDDDLEQATACAEAGLKVLLFGEYGWNRTDKLHKNIKRAKDWAAVKDYFDAQPR